MLEDIDARLIDRLDDFSKRLNQHRTPVIRQLAKGTNEKKAFHRMLDNKRLTVEQVATYTYADTIRQLKEDRDYVLFQDTTQLNYNRNRHLFDKDDPHLGVIGDNKSIGFFAHAIAAMDVQSGNVLGLASTHLWRRLPKGHPGRKAPGKERDYSKERFETKESYRWLRETELAAQRMRQGGATGRIEIVSDAESDIHDIYAADLGEDVGLIIRCGMRRKAEQNGERVGLHEFMQQYEPSYYKLKVRNDKRKKSRRIGRTAKIELRWGPITLSPPLARKDLEPAQMYAVYAVEHESTIPKGKKRGAKWFLLSTLPVETEEQAMKVIRKYELRWTAEQLFRLSKRKGFNAEESDLESGLGLQKLYLMVLMSSCKVLGLHRAARKEEPVPIDGMFTDEQVKCMKYMHGKYEGNTKKQKNPHHEGTRQWAFWIIARMGGWKPFDPKAGVIVLNRGWNYFLRVFEGWMAAKDVST